MTHEVIASPLVQKHPPVAEIGRYFANLGVRLPEEHEALLAASDGVTGFEGYFRIFGFTRAVGALVDWNHEECWKFAWPKHCREFLCFAETAWGDQYSYRLEDLFAGRNPSVYFLDAITMEPEVIAPSFRGFVHDEFLRNCEAPYDAAIVVAAEKLGPLANDEHLVYVPSPLVTGDESLSSVQLMPSVAAMIANGDLCVQLAHEEQSRVVEGIDTYVDSRGRPRLRVVWSCH